MCWEKVFEFIAVFNGEIICQMLKANVRESCLTSYFIHGDQTWLVKALSLKLSHSFV